MSRVRAQVSGPSARQQATHQGDAQAPRAAEQRRAQRHKRKRRREIAAAQRSENSSEALLT